MNKLEKTFKKSRKKVKGLAILLEDEYKMFKEIVEEFDRLVDEKFSKYGFDRFFYNFRLIVDFKNEDLNKIDSIVLFDDTELGFCIFCQAPTYYYNDETSSYVCVECFGKLKNKENSSGENK